jgi:hypothetical protein
MTTKAWLEGDPHDLQVLAHLLADGDTCVVHDAEKDAYYLTAPEIDDPPAGAQFYEVAKKELARLNGFAHLVDGGFRPVTLSGAFSQGDSVHQVIFAEASGVLRAQVGVPTVTVTRPDGTLVLPPPSPWPGRYAMAAKYPRVDEVLEKYSQAELPNWAELFKIHEIIQESIEGSIPKMGWASIADEDAFGASATRRDVSGKDARHARTEKRPPPKRTMIIQEGRDYIQGIVLKWLEWLRNQP